MDSSIILREKEAGKNMIRVDNVSKSYGDKRVLNNVSCEFEDGKIYTGSNVENASFGATNCAERTAIFKGVHEGNREIKAVAVVGDTNAYTYPCGICRQVIAEFVVDEKIPVIIIKNENDYIMKTFEEILPGVFSKKDLKG